MGETFLDIYGNQMYCLLHCHCRNSTLPWTPSYDNCGTSCCTSISNTEFKNLTKENTYFKSLAQNFTQELSNITKLYESSRENVQPTVTSIITDCTPENVLLGVFVVLGVIALLFLFSWIIKLCDTNDHLKNEITSLNATVTTQNSKIQEFEKDLAAAQLAQGVGNQYENGDPPANVPIAYANTGS